MSPLGDPSNARIVFCSGKLYYDLLHARDERKSDHVAICRVEQLYPFAADQARDILARYPVGAEVVWAQEEPRNMGPWHFLHAMGITVPSCVVFALACNRLVFRRRAIFGLALEDAAVS